jgi:ferredoxin-NADP reductase
MLLYLSSLVLILVAANISLSLFSKAKQARQAHARISIENERLEQEVDKLIQQSSIREQQLNAWSGWRKFRVAKICIENETVKSFYLKPHDGKPLPRFLAGQHLTFRLKIPGQIKPVVRCYSLSDDANETAHYRVSIRRQAAPVGTNGLLDGLSSSFFHDEIIENDVLDVKAPAGKFYLDTSERGPVALVAGGIGLTPSLSMINTLYSQSSKRQVFMFYAVRDIDDLIMAKHFSKLERKMANLQVHYFFSELDQDLISERKHQGFVSVKRMFDLISDTVSPLDVDYFVCGPPPMMDAIVGGLEHSEIDSQRIHFESFGPTTIGKRNAPQVTDLVNKTCTVNFRVSEKLIEWSSSNGTLLEAAEEAGIAIESGCRAGSCGTCLTAILAGDVEYIDEPGTDVEKGSCLPCIAIPKKNLTLNA